MESSPSRGEIKVYLGWAKMNQKWLKQLLRLRGLLGVLSGGRGQSPAQDTQEGQGLEHRVPEAGTWSVRRTVRLPFAREPMFIG